MSWHLLLILRYKTETALVEEKKKSCLMFAVSYCCVPASWDILEVPQQLSESRGQISQHRHKAPKPNGACVLGESTCRYLFECHFAEHIRILTWYGENFESHRLWIRLLPRLWWGGGILFILYIYILKRFEKGGFDMFALITILWTALKCK